MPESRKWLSLAGREQHQIQLFGENLSKASFIAPILFFNSNDASKSMT